jgi:hypothetical protein
VPKKISLSILHVDCRGTHRSVLIRAGRRSSSRSVCCWSSSSTDDTENVCHLSPVVGPSHPPTTRMLTGAGRRPRSSSKTARRWSSSSKSVRRWSSSRSTCHWSSYSTWTGPGHPQRPRTPLVVFPPRPNSEIGEGERIKSQGHSDPPPSVPGLVYRS